MAVDAESQLDEDVRDVLLDRALALAQALGDRDVPEPFRDELGDVALSVGQLRQTAVAAALIEEDVEDRRVQRETTAVDLVQRTHDVVSGRPGAAAHHPEALPLRAEQLR